MSSSPYTYTIPTDLGSIELSACAGDSGPDLVLRLPGLPDSVILTHQSAHALGWAIMDLMRPDVTLNQESL